MTQEDNNIFKPIAFSLSKCLIDNDIKFLSNNINFYSTKIQGWYLNLWHIGDKFNSVNNFYFSFPQSKSLLDRNLIISITNNKIVIENDWLGSIPVFYNQKESIISTISGLCLKDKAIDNEGLINFFDFGYSVFEHTPFKEVKFLRYFSKLIIESDLIKVEYKDDPVLEKDLFKISSTPEEAVRLIKDYIYSIEKKTTGEIIIPTSGGYDSRLLNWAIKDKQRVHSFTYGISKDQCKSHEVVFAKKISEILKTKWNQIELSNYNDYIEDWYRLFGFSTHLHGMYHIEFYKKIFLLNKGSLNTTLLSGIIGDAWAGSVKFIQVSNEKDIRKLGYSHGMNLDSSFLYQTPTNKIIKLYFEKNKHLLHDPKLQVVFIMRLKLILLSYLTSIPEYFGVPVWTPFLNLDVATTMLRLPEESRINRQWQKDLFKKENLDIENMNLRYSTTNTLNHIAAEKHSFEPIQEKYFLNILNTNKIRKVNKKINQQNKFLEYILTSLKLRSVLRKIGIKKIGYLKHLSNYYTIKAIEKSIKNES